MSDLIKCKIDLQVILTGNILMVVYSSISVPGTEFVTLGDVPLPSCLNTTELHVVGDLDLMMRPAVVTNEGAGCYGNLKESLKTFSTSDGIPVVCGGASEEAAVGCSAFYPGSGSEPGEWIPRGDHDWSIMP